MTTLCVSGDNDARAEAERSEQDLQAQQNMAEWARGLTVLTFAQLGIGLLGTFLLFRTIGEARKGNQINRLIGKSQTRAYIGSRVRGVRFNSETNTLVFRVVFDNSGQTPARDFTCGVGSAFGPTYPSGLDDVPARIGGEGSRTHLGAGGKFRVNVTRADPVEWARAGVGATRFWLVGHANYRDVFGRRHTTSFRRYLDGTTLFGNRPKFLTDSEGNDED